MEQKAAMRLMRKAIWIGILLVLPTSLMAQYALDLRGVDKESSIIRSAVGIPQSFKTRELCEKYIAALPELLINKGYPSASIDSFQFDSTTAIVYLFLGDYYQMASVDTDSIDLVLLNAGNWNKKQYEGKALNMEEIRRRQELMLTYLENNGYPFASVTLNNVEIDSGNMSAVLKIEKGPLYKIDSLRNLGTANVSTDFLSRYLSIENGSMYQKDKLRNVSTRLLELPYLKETKPWDLTLLGTGSVLNLYLEPKKSSQINVLIGLLPSNEQLAGNKMLVTGEATINLRNALGNGELIGLDWQQIQVQSPRLNIQFQQPYLFNTPFGVNFNFNLFKKDSSFININMLAGVQYTLSSKQSGSVFIQNFTTNLLSVDTFRVKNSRALPAEADLRSLSLGVNYLLAATDYRFNPRKGNELDISLAAGTKNIRKNNVITKLYDQRDPSFNFNSLYDTMQLKSYQFRLKISGAHYFPLTRTSTLKVAGNVGWFQSPSVFRNELFQIGGYRLLRGFDEESIFASRYGVSTAEYRYFLGMNSFLFTFVDFGWAQNTSLKNSNPHTYFGTGLGMAFETNAGIFNISTAVGKRNDTNLNLRQSKIHLGYVNYF